MTTPIQLPAPFVDLALPRRDLGPSLPIPRHDPSAAESALHATWHGHEPTLVALLNQLDKPELGRDRSLPNDPNDAALHFVAAQSVVDSLVNPLIATFVDWWVAERDVSFAVAAALAIPATQELVRKYRKVAGYGRLVEEASYRLRRHIAVADEAVLPEVERQLEACTTGQFAGFVVTIAPHRSDWVAARLEQLLPITRSSRPETILLAISDPEDLRQITLRGAVHNPAVVPTLLHTLGAELEPWLSEIAAKQSPIPEPVQIALEAFGSATGTGLPVFIDLDGFDEVIGSDGSVWAPDELERSLTALSRGSDSGITEELSPFERARLVDQILEQWAAADYPETHAWVLDAVEQLGDEETVRSLFGKKAWSPIMRRHKDRLWAMLSAKDTRAAREHIAVRDRSVKWGVQQPGPVSERLVERLQVPSIEHVRDASVPTFGLSPYEPAAFDLGGRRLTVELDEELAVRLRDEGERVLKSFPRQKPTDDPSAYREAKFRHRQARTQVPRVADDQRTRFEDAMLDCRNWTGSQFRTWFVEHPILRRFVERLLWACGSYEHPTLFRVAEDGSLAGHTDEAVDLSDAETVWIHHPMRSTSDQLSTWRRVFSDYEIVQPFPQLDRPSWGPTEAEATAHATSFVGRSAPAAKWMDLKKQGFTANSTGRELRRRDGAHSVSLRFDRPGMARKHTDPYMLDRLNFRFSGAGSNERASELARFLDQVFNS